MFLMYNRLCLNKLFVIFFFFHLLFTSNVFAGNYTAVIDDLQSLEIDRIELSHQNIMLEPESSERNFFLAATSFLHAIVKNDGGDIDSISEMLNVYGLQFGFTLQEITPIVVDGVDQISVSNKSINDFRDFLESWKSNISYSRSLLSGIPDDFKSNIFTVEGFIVQFDYTDVKIFESLLDLIECGIDYFCAHEFNGTPLMFYNSLSSIADKSDFLYFRNNYSEYLNRAKSHCVDAIHNSQLSLNYYNSEVAVDLGVEEFISLSEDAVLALPEIFSKLLESISTGNEVNFGTETLDTVNLSVLFNGTLPLAKILPKFSDTGFYFSSFGYKNRNDPTFSGLFPNLTQILLNKNLVEWAEFVPYILSLDSSVLLSDFSDMMPGYFNGIVKYLYDWEIQDTFISTLDGWINFYRNDSGINLYFHSFDANSYYELPLNSYYSVTDDVSRFLFEYETKNIEVIIRKDGNIYLNTFQNEPDSGYVDVYFSYYSSGMAEPVYKQYFIDPNQSDLNSLKIIPYPTFSISYSSIVPSINLLIAD